MDAGSIGCESRRAWIPPTSTAGEVSARIRATNSGIDRGPVTVAITVAPGLRAPRRRGAARRLADHRRAGDTCHTNPDQLTDEGVGTLEDHRRVPAALAGELAAAVSLLHQHLDLGAHLCLELRPRDALLEREDGLIPALFHGLRHVVWPSARFGAPSRPRPHAHTP